jgi:hypothetical protein
MPTHHSHGRPRRANARFVVAILLGMTLANCGRGGNAGTLAELAAPVEMIDDAAAEELRASFLEVSGSGRVTFAPRSARLTPAAAFQLERQALWLKEHDFVGIRFRAESASAKGVEERRLAVRRSEAVEAYLKEYGVRPSQFVGVDVAFGRSDTVTTMIDPFHVAPERLDASTGVARPQVPARPRQFFRPS